LETFCFLANLGSKVTTGYSKSEIAFERFSSTDQRKSLGDNPFSCQLCKAKSQHITVTLKIFKGVPGLASPISVRVETAYFPVNLSSKVTTDYSKSE
jgi:hypothetical protein